MSSRCFDVEIRQVPLEGDALGLRPADLEKYCDENTIGVVPTFGATFSTVYEPIAALAVTLDADTRLPRDTVRRLIGKTAHPLNRPRLDAVARRVVEGHAALQPRVTPSLPIGREGSLFQRIFSSLSGIDPCALAVSDVYQDLFGEGPYGAKASMTSMLSRLRSPAGRRIRGC